MSCDPLHCPALPCPALPLLQWSVLPFFVRALVVRARQLCLSSASVLSLCLLCDDWGDRLTSLSRSVVTPTDSDLLVPSGWVIQLASQFILLLIILGSTQTSKGDRHTRERQRKPPHHSIFVVPVLSSNSISLATRILKSFLSDSPPEPWLPSPACDQTTPVWLDILIRPGTLTWKLLRTEPTSATPCLTTTPPGSQFLARHFEVVFLLPSCSNSGR